jgi:hypothetical protein
MNPTPAETPSSRPILVTGAHRTGTTWVGRMLAAGGQAAYISEPLNRWHRPGVLRLPIDQWYTYICPDNEQAYLPALIELLEYRYHLLAELRVLGRGGRLRKDILRMGRDWSTFIIGRLQRRRPLLKDPFAVFSSAWFLQRLHFQVVVTIRHPAAFASSLKRLNWPFDFGDLLSQPLLMRDCLEPFRSEIESLSAFRPRANPLEIVDQAALLWKVIYTCVESLRRDHPEILLARHEDLSLDPEGGFRELYSRLGLEFNAAARQIVQQSSSSDNPTELTTRQVHRTHLDSRANLDNWKRRLAPNEINVIRARAGEVAARYYPESVW